MSRAKRVESVFVKQERRDAYTTRRTNAVAKASAEIAALDTSDEGKFLLDCIERLFDAYALYGFRYAQTAKDTANKRVAIQRTLTFWKAQSLRCGSGLPGCIKYLKFKLAAFKAAWFRTELPPAPWKLGGPAGPPDQPLLLITGRAHRFVLKLWRTPWALDSSSFCVTVTQGVKRAFPRPTPAMLRAAEWSTFQDLTKAPTEKKSYPVPWESLREDGKDPKDLPLRVGKPEILQKIKQVVDAMFPKDGYRVADRVRPFVPSTRANVEFSRGKGGMWRSLRPELSTDSSASDEVEYAADARKDLQSALDAERRKLLHGLRGPSGGISLTTYRNEEEQIGAPRNPSVLVDDTELVSHAEQFYMRLLDQAVSEPPRAAPLGLAEPLKVRVITKGPPLLYGSMMPLQKYLWRVLAGQRITQLVGRPIDERVLLDQLGAELPAGFAYLSGDYTAATNNLNSWVSNAVAEALSDRIGLTQQERELFIRSLTGHELECSDPAGDVLRPDGSIRYGPKERKPQLNGQLMGSVTSFPVLCIANIALCWLAMETGERRHIHFDDLRLLVNGDDCVFVANTFIRRAWEHLGHIMGLEPSLGKYFFSEEFVEMNSTMYRVGPQWPLAFARTRSGRERPLPSAPRDLHNPEKIVMRMCPFIFIPWVNYGLVAGVKRSESAQGSTKVDVTGIYGLGARHRQLKATAPWWMWDSVSQAFLRENAEVLSEAKGLPWFIPETLGGLGLAGLPSEEDCRRALGALYHIFEWSQSAASLVDPNGWMIRRVAERRLAKLDVETLNEQEATMLSSAVGQLSNAVLFGEESLKDLIAPEEQAGKESLVRQRRFLRYLGWYGQPRFGMPKLRPASLAQEVAGTLDDGTVSRELTIARQQATIDYLWSFRYPTVGPRVHLKRARRIDNDPEMLPKDQFVMAQAAALLRDLSTAADVEIAYVQGLDESLPALDGVLPVPLERQAGQLSPTAVGRRPPLTSGEIRQADMPGLGLGL